MPFSSMRSASACFFFFVLFHGGTARALARSGLALLYRIARPKLIDLTSVLFPCGHSPKRELNLHR